MDDLREPEKNTPGLPPDAVQLVTLEARKEGVFAGLTSGLVSVLIGARLFGFKRNAALASGVLGGVLSGYLFTLAFRDTAMAQLRAEEARLRSQARNNTESQPSSETFTV